MRDVLTEVVKKIGGLGFIPTIKVTGTSDETKFEAIDGDKTVIVKAILNEPAKQLEGEFGISSLSLLSGLMNFSSYKTDDATFSVKRRGEGDKSSPEVFEFRDENGLGSDFRLMSGKLVPEQPLVADIKWDVSFTPTKSKIQEFSALSGLYSQFDQFFAVKTDGDGGIVFAIGEDNSATHKAAMVFADDVKGELKGDLLWPITQFLSIIKLAEGNEYTIGVTSKGAMQILVKTDIAQYRYILPAKRR